LAPLGWDAPDTILAAAIDSKFDRLEREAATLRNMRAELFEGGGRREQYPAGSGLESHSDDHSDHSSEVPPELVIPQQGIGVDG
jgi:hypothetical protein